MQKKDFEHLRKEKKGEKKKKWKMKENVHFSLRNTGVPSRRTLQNAHFPLEKVGNAETTKMNHFRMYTFSQRKLGSRPRMCGFVGARVPFQNVHYSLGNQGSRPGSPFSPGEEQTFSECALFQRKNGEPSGRGPRGDFEGPARTSILEKRDEYLQN